MRGEAMSVTAAVRGSIVLLLSMSVVKGQNGWSVSYTSHQICAPRGSTVSMSCIFTYPKTTGHKLERTLWFTSTEEQYFIDVESNPQFSGRVRNTCTVNRCTLTIRDLRQSDITEYKFRMITNKDRYFGNPGVGMYVRELRVTASQDPSRSLQCVSRCPLDTAFIWFKNGQKINQKTPKYDPGHGLSKSRYSCAAEGYEAFPSPSVYAPGQPLVSVSPSAEVEEGTAVNLSCSSDANPAVYYIWYKVTGTQNLSYLQSGPLLTFSFIKSTDSGEYFCEAENDLGKTRSKHISVTVKYAPKPPSVSVSPSAEVEEGTAVNLSCSSDANPAANYTWYKNPGPQNLGHLQSGPLLTFSFIKSTDSGEFFCEAENELGTRRSKHISVTVKYAPKPPSVSVSPSAEIVEGTAVKLSCSSDAKPAANYTWYKNPGPQNLGHLQSGPLLTFSFFKSTDSGEYFCEAENELGTRKSTHISVTVKYDGGIIIAITAGAVPAVLLVVVFLCVILWIRKKRTPSESSLAERPNNRRQRKVDEQEEPQYADIHFSEDQANLYQNIGPAQPAGHTEQEEVVEYTTIKFASAARRTNQEEDCSVLYSTVNKAK